MDYQNPSVSVPQPPNKKSSSIKDELGKKYQEMDPAYFVFIDALGFKETFHNNDRAFRQVFEYFNSLMDQMRCLRNDGKNCYAGQTSDSLYFYTSKLNYLNDFLNVFLHFNVYAMSKGVFFRGGIAKGKLYYNEPYQFYGNCVINSFLLEDKISKFPRITIDKQTISDLKETVKEWRFDDDKHRSYLNPFSRKAMDDISDYLTPPVPNLQTVNIDLIKSVKKVIQQNIKQYEFDDTTCQKYWYLLDSCEKLLSELNNK